jgi:galactokinase
VPDSAPEPSEAGPPTHARWAAPGRVNLIGEPTDYAGGLALPFAVAQSCTAVVRRRREPGLVARSAQATSTDDAGPIGADVSDLDALPGWVRYVLGPALVLRGRGVDLPGPEVVIDSDVPLGAGLSSSAAVVCSVTTALDDLLGLGLSADDLLAVSRAAENDVVGAPTGGLDQLASLRCTTGHALLCDFLDAEDPRTEQVPFDPAAEGLTVLVVDTRTSHSHADGEYAARRRACADAVRLLGVTSLRAVGVDDLSAVLADLPGQEGDGPGLRACVRHVVTENDRVEQTVARLRDGGAATIGDLLSASHASLRDDYRVTVPALDVAAAALEDGGALGARMTGGGFGGSVIGLVPQDARASAEAAVRRAFAEHGFDEPEVFEVTPSRGARRVEDP